MSSNNESHGSCSYSINPSEDHRTDLDTSWSCPHETENGGDYCLFHMSDKKRSEHNVSNEDISQRIVDNMNSDERELNEYIGANLPRVTFSYDKVDGKTNHPLNFQYATIDDLDLTRSNVKQGINISNAKIGSISLEDATIHGDFVANGTEFNGSVNMEESNFLRNGEFEGAVFNDEAVFDEMVFNDESTFVDAVFKNIAKIRGVTFSGKSHEIDNNADFTGCTFENVAMFDHSDFEHVKFKDLSFKDLASFNQCEFNGDTIFTGSVFYSDTEFKNVIFEENAVFENTRFKSKLDFSQSEFYGGNSSVNGGLIFKNSEFEDVVLLNHCEFHRSDFSGVVFHNNVNVRESNFHEDAIFKGVEFKKECDFEESEFEEDLDFSDAKFNQEADFDETNFYGDVKFESAVFRGDAVFRGAEFLGDSRHLNYNVTFDNTKFKGPAFFDNVKFRTASFLHTEFSENCDFEESEFTERVNFEIEPNCNSKLYVDMTEAEISEGSITLDSSGSVVYDMTEAVVGDVKLSTEAGSTRYELLDYFRFCRSVFDGFEFSNHYDYFERNKWNIHDFADDDIDVEYSVPMTYSNIEQTYNNASGNASDNSEKKAAREFSVKRHRFSRRKNKKMGLDTSEPLNFKTRMQKLVGASLNYFLDVSCGYRTKLLRITAITFVVIPFVFALFYALGGPFETTAGSIFASSNPILTFAENLHFSYITFTTVGYGNNGAIAPGSATLTAIEGSLSVMFGVLFTATFIGRFLEF